MKNLNLVGKNKQTELKKVKTLKFKSCFFILIMFFTIVFSSCGASPKYVRRVQAMEEGVQSPTTIDELKEAISKYENRVEDIVAATEQTGIWYKILATRYIDKEMYGEALDALQMAIQTFPSNQNLFYYIGVCAGYMAKAKLEYPTTPDKSSFKTMDRESYLKLSESGYLRAIEIQSDYSRAMYGLGVLYVFEMDESEKAIPYLETFMSIQKSDINGMFVLARAYVDQGEYDKAVALYDKIANTTSLEKRKAEAIQNKQQVLDMSYGSN